MRRPPSCLPSRWRLLACFSLLLWLGCVSEPEGNALGVTVRFAPGAEPLCVQVFARAPGAAEKLTGPMQRAGEDELKVAIYRGELPASILVGARGYDTEGCEGELVARSEEREVTFDPREVSSLSLRLHQVGDEDGDGYLAVSAGGDDCDDANVEVHPGVTERCGDGMDNDCSGRQDCKDAFCVDAPCQAGGTCSAAGFCVGASEEVDCTDGVDNDGDGSIDCAEASCNAKPCQGPNLCLQGQTCQGGSCQGGAAKSCTTVSACRDENGTCEPSTGECGFVAKPGGPCDDQDACTQGDTCDAAGLCVAQAQVSCTQSVDTCREPTGTCNKQNGTCRYAVRVGVACNDGNPCSSASSCDPTGACVPTAVQACNSPPNGQCFEAAGVCDPGDGQCDYVPKTGQGCDDANVCTVGDSCSGSGQCQGAPKCVSSNPCMHPTCSADGTCGLVNALQGTPCPGGLCNGQGACSAAFPYPPTNFLPPALSEHSEPVNLSCGATALFDSSSLTFPVWCPGQPQPTPKLITQTGGTEAVLLPMKGFVLGAGTTLRLSGIRPVILVVQGDATVAGHLDAGSQPGARGAGGSRSGDCSGGSGQDGSFSNSGSETVWSGGGGGGFGSGGGNGGKSANGEPGGNGGNTAPSGNPLSPLRGGCAGGASGNAAVAGGEGGGAIQLSASGTVSISGVVSASGQGGPGSATDRVGGGGGGSGGGVLLEGKALSFTDGARLTVNGGGGGEGRSIVTSGQGGQDGTLSSTAAAGGSGGSVIGGDGGNGAVGTNDGQNGQAGQQEQTPLGDVEGGGGGGGGGVGRIRLNAVDACARNNAFFSGIVSRFGACL